MLQQLSYLIEGVNEKQEQKYASQNGKDVDPPSNTSRGGQIRFFNYSRNNFIGFVPQVTWVDIVG